MTRNVAAFTRALALLAALACLCAAIPCMAENKAQRPEPFSINNQSPLALALLPFSPASAHVADKGANSFRVSAAYSNVFTKQSSSKATLNLDMEGRVKRKRGLPGKRATFFTGALGRD